MSDRRVLEDMEQTFRAQKLLAERAIAQLDDDQLHEVIHPEINPVAVIVKHLAGNMRSRWVGFPEADGEKADRHRDEEFRDTLRSRRAILNAWETGWSCVFDALAPLVDQDLDRLTTIRGEPHRLSLAILRQTSHYGYHVGQIVTIARMLAGERWTTLSVPRGGSDAFNRRMRERFASGSRSEEDAPEDRRLSPDADAPA